MGNEGRKGFQTFYCEVAISELEDEFRVSGLSFGHEEHANSRMTFFSMHD